MKYNYLDDRRLHRKLITSLWIITLLIVVLVTVGIIIFVDSIKDDKHTSDVTTNPTESVIATRDNIIRSSYFQFQAPKNWIEVAGESVSPNFVYRKIDGTLIKGELKISVNSDSSLTKATRVLPVTPDGNRLMVSKVSDHCSNDKRFTPGPENPVTMSWQGVQLICNPDSVSEYRVVVGQTGPSPNIVLTRPDGSNVSYKIVYTDLSANPSTNDITAILESFQTR